MLFAESIVPAGPDAPSPQPQEQPPDELDELDELDRSDPQASERSFSGPDMPPAPGKKTR
jgi:hypothetical protein